MEFFLPLATLAIVQLLAVISPGQSFVIISKLALANGRKPALAATLGLGTGTVIWAIGAIAGLAIILKQAAWLYALLKVGGGIYLLYLAFGLWRDATLKPSINNAQKLPLSSSKAYKLGLMTQMANPKVAVFFGSIFFALLPANSPNWVFAASVLIVFTNEIGWNALVSMFFSVDKTRSVYLKAKTSIDRIMAGVLGLIGAGLVIDAGNSFSE